MWLILLIDATQTTRQETLKLTDLAAPKAPAQAKGFGFPKTQAGPKANSGQHLGPAWPGFFGPGLARLLASGQSRHITIGRQQRHTIHPLLN
jgi:hypothetical protein